MPLTGRSQYGSPLLCSDPREDQHIASIEPLFTYQDSTQRDRLINLLNQAPAGSTVRFSVFLFYYRSTGSALPSALVRAARRGVNVQMLVDLPGKNPARRTHAAFHRDFKPIPEGAGAGNTWIRRHNTNVGWSDKNHTKFFLFPDTGQGRTIIQSSENLTDAATTKHQAGLVISDDLLFDNFTKYWTEIKDGTFNNYSTVVGSVAKAYFFPRFDRGDVVESFLKGLSTRYARHRRTGEPAVVIVCMPRWTWERRALAAKLVELARAGYYVTVIIRLDEGSVDMRILQVLASSYYPPIDAVPINLLAVRNADFKFHGKYFLFRGYYGGRRRTWQELVWCGSHNFTGRALRKNYETLIKVRNNNAIWRAFAKNAHHLAREIGTKAALRIQLDAPTARSRRPLDR